MKRVIIREPHQIQVFDDADPTPGPGEVLLEVKAVGICGSDLHTMEGSHPFVPDYPILPGHEVSAVVRSVGEGVDDVYLGKKVALEPGLIAGTFPQGRYNIATGLRVMGFQAPGAMAELFAAPVDRVHMLPDDFSFDAGAFVEPTAVAVHAVKLVGSVAGKEVGVIGAGTIGLLTAQVARAYNAASVKIADLDPARQAVARKLDLDTGDQLEDRAYDVVFECVGVEGSMRSAILSCRKGATIVVLGVFGSDVTLPIKYVQDWELAILGSLMYVDEDYRETIRLLHKGDVRYEEIITHHFPLADAVTAFDTAAKRGDVLKVMLEVNS